eukprot:11220842-Lingulodinium_polyedra.AAC.1
MEFPACVQLQFFGKVGQVLKAMEVQAAVAQEIGALSERTPKRQAVRGPFGWKTLATAPQPTHG